MELGKDVKEDIQERINKFLKGYKKLIDETQVDFIHYPEYIPTNEGVFVTRIASQPVDTKYRSVPSPISGDIIKK